MLRQQSLFSGIFGAGLGAGTVLVLLLGWAKPAAAQSAAAVGAPASPKLGREAPPSASETRWYGYQPAIADLAAAGSLYAAVATLCFSLSDDPPPCSAAPSAFFFLTGATTYLVASPAIHAAHGHWDKAGLSFGIRLAPIALALAVNGLGGDRGSSNPTAITLLGGAAAAVLIDDVMIARETVPASRASWYVMPAIDPKAHAAIVALGGQF